MINKYCKQLTRIHGSRSNGVDANPTAGQLLRNATSEVLDRGLGAGVGGVEAGESGQERSDDVDDLATVLDVLGRLLENQEGCLGVDAAIAGPSAHDR